MSLLTGSGRNQSLARAFRLLERLALHPDGATVAALARELELPRATVTRLLGSLRDEGAVARIDRAWVLGPTIVRLAAAAGPLAGLRAGARPLLERAAEQLQETVMLGVPTGPLSGRVIEEAPGPRLVGVGSWLGETMDTPASGFVRMLLAELPDDELDEAIGRLRLEPLTPHTITSPGELADAVRAARREDYCVIVDELEVGLAGLAVPVRRDAVLVALVGSYLPTSRFQAAARAAIRTTLTALARELEAQLNAG